MEDFVIFEFIGLFLKEKREKMGYTIEEAALRTDISREYYSKIEKGKASFTLIFLFKIIKVLKIEFPEFFKQINLRNVSTQEDIVEYDFDRILEYDFEKELSNIKHIPATSQVTFLNNRGKEVYSISLFDIKKSDLEKYNFKQKLFFIITLKEYVEEVVSYLLENDPKEIEVCKNFRNFISTLCDPHY